MCKCFLRVFLAFYKAQSTKQSSYPSPASPSHYAHHRNQNPPDPRKCRTRLGVDGCDGGGVMGGISKGVYVFSRVFSCF